MGFAKRHKDIKFSVCIPYFNTGMFISECINSVASQTHNNWEIIVLNDGSDKQNTSDLKKTINKYCARLNNNIIVISRDNGGLFSARCKMYKEATGDVIINLDADDCLFSDKALEKIAKTFVNKQAGMVIFNATRNSAGTPNKKLNTITNNDGNVSIDLLRQEFCCNDQLNNVWMKAIPRQTVLQAIEDIPNVELRLNMTEDIYLSTFFLDKVKSAFVINEPLYFYRVNMNSTVFKSFDNKRLDDQIFVQKHLENYADKWSINGFDPIKHTCEFLIYGDLMYVNLCNANKNIKMQAYAELRENKFISKRIESFNYKGTPKHKAIPLRYFKNKKYSNIEWYFKIIEAIKKLRNK